MNKDMAHVTKGYSCDLKVNLSKYLTWNLRVTWRIYIICYIFEQKLEIWYSINSENLSFSPFHTTWVQNNKCKKGNSNQWNFLGVILLCSHQWDPKVLKNNETVKCWVNKQQTNIFIRPGGRSESSKRADLFYFCTIERECSWFGSWKLG